MDTVIPKDIQEMMKQKQLEGIRDRLKEAKSANAAEVKSPLLLQPSYFGNRYNWTAYHPLACPNSTKAFEFARKNFQAELRAWYDVIDLYKSEMPLSENVVSKNFKDELAKVVAEIDKAQDPYMYEALAMILWDKEGATQEADGGFVGTSEKTGQHDLSMMSELKQMAKELMDQDMGGYSPKPIDQASLIRHGWTG